MTQFNLDTPIDPTVKSGSVLASDLSSWRDALHSNHIGASVPAYVQAGMIWINNSATPWVVNMYDGTDNIVIGTINASTNKFVPGATPSEVFTSIKQAATTTATGVVELATPAETQAGSDATRAVTPYSMANGASITTDGYYKMPGGMTIQWGYIASVPGAGSTAVVYPFAFPTATLSVNCTPVGSSSGGGTGDWWGVTTVLSTGFTATSQYDGAHAAYWMAIGY